MSEKIDDISAIEVWNFSIGRLVRKNIKKSSTKSCYCCCKTDKLTQHHIIPKSAGGMNTKDNIASLCEGCHVKLHQVKGDVNMAKAKTANDKWWLERLEKLKLFKELEREFRR